MSGLSQDLTQIKADIAAAKAAADAAGIGVNQTWQDVTASRALGVTYTNSSGKPITVAMSNYAALQLTASIRAFIDGVELFANGVNQGSAGTMYCSLTFVVPEGSAYRVDAINTSSSIKWGELR